MPVDRRAYDDLACPLTLRPHQAEALASVERARAAGSTRWWVTMPPGAGKTLVGTELARSLARPTVVFSPNTAIQGQWARTWDSYGTSGSLAAGLDRSLATGFTSLTYQSLAVFDRESDDDAEPEQPDEAPGSDVPPGLEGLHPNGLALVERLREAGPILLVLDECHHLLEVWGRLLRDVLATLPDALVLGLTATPPDAMTRSQRDLTAELFGPVLHEARIPALVRAGSLAPYAELAWLVEPTEAEAEWLRGQSERFAELVADLHSPSFGTVPFPVWQQQRWCDPIDAGQATWAALAAEEPELADARLRLVHAGLADLPEGARLREPHRHDPTARDWMVLLDDWVTRCVRPSSAEADAQVLTALRRALPAIGFVLTRRGIRTSRSGADRVVARSAAKEQGVVAIITEEAATLGDDCRALVLCDHEVATATASARLDDAPPAAAGSARGVLASLLADPTTATTAPLLVTGRTVAADDTTLLRLRDHVATSDPTLAAALEVRDGELVGPWRSGVWVRHVTDFFTSGGTRCLIGTRGLLGEGWDAPAVTTLIDLTTATTATAVVQTRGRALRIDPARPDKVALIWTVVCVSADHVAGGNDWDRFARKHVGYFSIDLNGSAPTADGAESSVEVVDGVAGIDRRFSPFAPPPPEEFATIDADMLQRADRRDAVREAWLSGPTPVDAVHHVLRVRPERTAAVVVPQTRATGSLAHRTWAPTRWWLGALWLLATLAASAQTPALAATVAVVLGGGLVAARGRRQLQWERDRPATVQHVALAVADAMRSTDRSPVGAEGVRVHVRSDGTVSFELAGVDEAVSATFTESLDEALSPIAAPRFVVRRQVHAGRTGALQMLTAAVRVGHQPEGEVWHAVPSAWARRKVDRAAYALAWHRWLGDGHLVAADSPEGVGVLAAQRGQDPFAVTTVIRRVWG